MILSRTSPDLRIGASTETASKLTADVELDVGITHQERLSVRINRNELDSSEPKFDHPVDSIDATAANADHLDNGEVVLVRCHVRPPGNTFNLYLRSKVMLGIYFLIRKLSVSTGPAPQALPRVAKSTTNIQQKWHSAPGSTPANHRA